ncbi:MAG: formate dehydrogenase subunit alpha [Lentisphaerae bacterium RIFOXYB12_FULL_65_16]|nr:MAG: formate dehydrogenase subunit alpha [Lentisphaerae bacterium RIFOXYA12_64_32]OGV91136.1 MAG: formate dehydrogenase subunit alpha [Lentisphaerae bacterium RIFOXYB12_FULL_65_16]
MADQVLLTIDERRVTVAAGSTILEAALGAGIDIPHLCHDPRLVPTGACRLCIVEVEGERGLQTSCSRQAANGMIVRTNTPAVRALRRTALSLLLSEHRITCTTCDKDGDCLLQDYAYEYQADESLFPNVSPRPGQPNYTTGNAAIEYDPSKCVRCQRCVRFCSEVQMAEALTLRGRGTQVEVTTGFDVELNNSTCELCGGCVNTCPTSALYDRPAKGLGRRRDLVKVRTTCSYCGVGCQMDLNVNRKLNRVVRVTSEPGCLPNDGNLCVKGKYATDFISDRERLTKPLLRVDGSFREVSWDEAIQAVAKGLTALRDQYGPDAIAFQSCSRCPNEENYLMQKLARMAGRTNNIDQCATTCHAPTVAGLASSFGSGAMTNSIAEIKNVQTLFLIGANPTDAHPIVGLEMKKARRKGARLIVCDPRETWMASRADIHIKHRPGTDNMLINAMMNHLVATGRFDRRFVAERCEDFDAFRANLEAYPLDLAARVCGVDADLIRKAAEWYAEGTPSSIFYTLGITEHTCGTENVQNLANLAMLCGQIGKESSGVNPLRGQNNVQGSCDMGAMPAHVSGYQKVADPAVQQKFLAAWGLPLPTNRGGRITDFIEQAGAGVLKGLYCMGEDLIRSEPNSTKVAEHLSKLQFLVCQDIFMTETAKLAHVVLPAACFAEKDGTFTNTERRVQRIRKAVEPPGEARPDWQILCDVATAMGYPMSYAHPGEIWDEMARLSPSLAGISYERIDKVGLSWPCPSKDHPGTQFLHKGSFPRGKGLFHVIRHRPPAEEPDKDYPLILSTGRTLYNYNVGNMTLKSPAISQKQSQNFVEMHQEDAARLGIQDGDMVRVVTRRGAVTVAARVACKVNPGALWMPFHFAETSTNLLTNDAFDNITRTAEYKCCAAAIQKP